MPAPRSPVNMMTDARHTPGIFDSVLKYVQEDLSNQHDTRTYPWGDASPTCDMVNEFNVCREEHEVDWSSEVASYPSDVSPYGVLDMAASVHEWVNDWYQEDYYTDPSASENPQGPRSGTEKVIRGGSWFLNGITYSMRVSERQRLEPSGDYFPVFGFRCARSP